MKKRICWVVVIGLMGGMGLARGEAGGTIMATKTPILDMMAQAGDDLNGDGEVAYDTGWGLEDVVFAPGRGLEDTWWGFIWVGLGDYAFGDGVGSAGLEGVEESVFDFLTEAP